MGWVGRADKSSMYVCMYIKQARQGKEERKEGRNKGIRKEC
jgi:hypothetical protein